MDPFLTNSTERELRKQVWTNYYSRGDNNDDYDNKEIIAKILKLRKERVALLGYDNYADWRLQNRMAKNPENALALMEAVWPAAIARVAEEVADMQAVADANGDNITIEPWDYRYYAEKVRRAKYDLNSDEVKQYLQLDNLTDAMHYVAGRLLTIRFLLCLKVLSPFFMRMLRFGKLPIKQQVIILDCGTLIPMPEKENAPVPGQQPTRVFQHLTEKQMCWHQTIQIL